MPLHQLDDNRVTDYSADYFLSGALVTNADNVIVYVNTYFKKELHWHCNELIGKYIDKILTKSSKIFLQSYVLPTLIHEKKCQEMQLIMLSAQGERMAVTVNAQLDEKGFIYWSFFNATQRDKLYDELIKTREKLEAQTERLQSLASTDELTSLLNRREMDYRSVLLLEQAKRTHRSVALLVIDIDDFKQINDTYGHLEGDRVLKELGQCLKKISRQTDLVARYGGEEFLIMLPDTNSADTLIFCQRLHQLIAEIKVGSEGLTVSVGACMSDSNSTFTELFKHADNAVYQAKANGKNTTYMHS
ncbi:GGDEF domain-containing protein [Pseudoalteromonas sp. S1610]|uniref:GGDEF domain-containing protein n=1 Tax=unclassified Pseudoalteromonas TaxID=194690 RepID=UPI00110AF397|nr:MULTISPECIES: GGDEF domain-containing protein [unclassified Pseudoalteromonas]MCK8125058.1 GGDEF domain-containing protein [Pseudoalteromonas sp. 2CM39R]TMP63357.1 GGDEF domain-containing protein [Pseudoalteromonas sp. S1610]